MNLLRSIPPTGAVARWALGLLLVPGLALAAHAAKPQAHPDQVLQRFAVGGDGGWDIITFDSAGHRLFVGRSSRVIAVGTDSGRVVGEIPDTPGAHAVALAPDVGRGYISNGRDSSVTVFDLKTLATLHKIPTGGRNPDEILYDSSTKRVFAFNAGTHNVTAIDAGADTVVGMVALGGAPEFAVADGDGRIFINLEDTSAVERFNARTLGVEAHWSLAPGKGPTGLAIDRAHHRLFAGCANQKLVVLDSERGTVVDTLPIGKGVDGVEFDPATGIIYVPGGSDGTLTEVHQDAPNVYRVLATLPTQKGARTLAFDPASHRVYLPTASFGDPPPPTPEHPHPRGPVVPGSFVILVVGPKP